MDKKKILNFIRQAEIIAQLSHDKQTQVGSILVDSVNFDQMASGYNGFVRGAKDVALPTTRPEKYEYMIHAEANLIYNAARKGIRTEGHIIVQTLSPCFSCARMLYQAGIRTIYFKDLYHVYDTCEKIEFCSNPLETVYIYKLKDILINLVKCGDYYKCTIAPNT
jgi:deoxycytidylate deaminase